ncbi:MAG: CDP-diacylglycerol--glycerol-3-phosphate 3-phosphatidyltransferase [Clostridia bacterium]|nr:CDP-diacylglycerol--glycerol-3-phosphate 3-phosphatidyltransferase [Clostridia bacterium]
MNTPNKLTVLRVILIPIFMIFYLLDRQWSVFAALLTYVTASLTDQLDGYRARKNNQVTTFGKLMDPLADKMLVMAALVCFMERDVPYINSWVIIIILAREFIVSGVRMLAMGDNNVIAASIWGKAKTVSQLVLTIAVMVFQIAVVYLPQIKPITDSLIGIMTVVAVVLTIYSGWDYVWKNKKLLSFK